VPARGIASIDRLIDAFVYQLYDSLIPVHESRTQISLTQITDLCSQLNYN